MISARTTKRGLLVAGIMGASMMLASQQAMATTQITLSGRGYGKVTTGGTYVTACDTNADNWGVRTRYYTSNGVTGVVGDANGSSSGCGGEEPTGGGRVLAVRVCAGVNGADTSCTPWLWAYPW
ncbi:hypothetical protein ABZ490_49995 [Streptomyces sp. NPDC005811]|uniref:hypothetical protein n=1 Tax=Streptomyces sp. NPDC005811 TaxID=3154565 RepID=UPI0033D0E783